MWGYIVAFLYSIIGPLVAYVIKAIGFGIVTYVGLSIIFDSLEYQVHSKISGIPSDLLNFANLMGFDTGIKIILATATACAAYKAMIASTGTVWKKPGSPRGIKDF